MINSEGIFDTANYLTL